jgi:GDPmannose 4,6-dehydratase
MFVTQKIAMSVARISLGYQECLMLGNLDSIRDWGHAIDYVEGIWSMLQHHTADDFVLCSEESHSVREFVELAFARVNIGIR